MVVGKCKLIFMFLVYQGITKKRKTEQIITIQRPTRTCLPLFHVSEDDISFDPIVLLYIFVQSILLLLVAFVQLVDIAVELLLLILIVVRVVILLLVMIIRIVSQAVVVAQVIVNFFILIIIIIIFQL